MSDIGELIEKFNSSKNVLSSLPSFKGIRAYEKETGESVKDQLNDRILLSVLGYCNNRFKATLNHDWLNLLYKRTSAPLDLPRPLPPPGKPVRTTHYPTQAELDQDRANHYARQRRRNVRNQEAYRGYGWGRKIPR